MKKNIFRFGYTGILFLSIFIGSEVSCTYNQITPVSKNTALCDTFKGDFKSQILPIIQANCNTNGCHNSGSGNGDFATDTNDLSWFINGTGSFKKRVFDGIGNAMPPSGFKSALEKDKLKCWFDKGHSLK